MPHGKSIVSSNDGEFDGGFKFLCQLVSQRTAGSPSAWTHIPMPRVDGLNDAYAGWYTACALTLKPHTPLDTLAKNRAKKAGTAETISFVNEFIRYSSNVGEEDKAGVGVFPAKPRHRIEPPRTVPVLEPRAGTPGQVTVDCRDESSAKWAKPRGVHGIEVRWNVQDHPPASREELVHSSFDTDSPLRLEFGEEDRGKRLYMYGSWEIEREGEKGPPGEIVSCVIP